MTSPRGRRLSNAEIEIWLKVAQSVTARPGAVLPRIAPAPTPARTPVAAEPAGDARAREPRPALPGYTPPQQRKAAQPPLAPFEKRYRSKVSRGRVEIEGVMDLHGLTQPEAHAALAGFLRSAQRDGAKLVLVVTGKGRQRFSDSAPAQEPGVLRRAVPLWLRAADLRTVVLGFEEASQPHGGMGALYVRLRRFDE